MLVAPFQATQLVFNTLLAPCNLGARRLVESAALCRDRLALLASQAV
jgi:hypothetical protein